MQNNSMVIDSQYFISTMGSEVVSFANEQKMLPYAFSKGKICNNDIVVYFNSDFSYNNVVSCFDDCLKNFCTFDDILYIATSSSNIQNIVKPSIIKQNDSQIINTVFDGHRIQIEKEEELISKVIIDGVNLNQSRTCKEGLIIIGSETLKMFIFDKPEVIRKVLITKEYDSFINFNFLTNSEIKVNDIFDKKIANSIKNLVQRKSADEIVIKEEKTVIELSSIAEDMYTLTFYHIEDIYMQVKKWFILYNDLTLCGDVNDEHNTLNTTFNLYGNDEKTRQTQFLLQKSCRTNITIMLTGESGTGKSFLARKIHEASERNKKDFVQINCAAIPYNLIESEMFGYEEGAFTGARKGGHDGYFSAANGGTLFLDEISEIPISLQGKLLDAIQTKSFFKVGGNTRIHSDIRIIAATNNDLRKMVNEKKFREDLFYRLNVFPIKIPSLRNRLNTLEFIIADILPELSDRCGVDPLILDPNALLKLKGYTWPGNIRELENVLEKAIVLSDGKIILPKDIVLPNDFSGNINKSFKEKKEAYEKQLILDALNSCNWERNKTANILGIGRTNLFEKIKKYNLLEGDVNDIE